MRQTGHSRSQAQKLGSHMAQNLKWMVPTPCLRDSGHDREAVNLSLESGS